MRTSDKKILELRNKVDHFLHSDSAKALDHAHELLKLAIEEDYKELEALAYNKIGYCYYSLRQLDSALENYNSSKEIYKELKHGDGLIDNLLSIGVIKRQQGNYKEALENYNAALQISEKRGKANPIIYNNIATIYFNQNEFEKSLKFYTKSLKLREKEKIKDQSVLIPVLTNIACIHYELGDYKQAEDIYKRVIDIGKKNNKPILYIAAIKGYSQLLIRNNKIDEAHTLLREGIALSQEANYHLEVIRLSLELADIQGELGEYEERKDILKQSLALAIDHQPDLIFSCLTKLLYHYEDVEDFTNAYKVQKQLMKLKEKKWQQEKDERLSELQAKFELREKDKLIEQEQKFIDELEDQNMQLSALNQELEQFNYAVSHDLKEPIRSVKAYTKLLLTHTKGKLNEDELEAVLKLEESIGRMQTMIEDLLQFAVLGSKEKSKTKVDLNEVVEIVKSSLLAQIDENDAIVEVEKLPTIQAHKSLMVQLFQNLISNAIKFRKPEAPPVVKINYTAEEKWHKIEIQDNGLGIPENQKEKVFKLFKQLKKSDGPGGSGIGLSLCQKIVTKMQGQIDLASELNKGSTFIVRLPRKLLS